MMAEHIQILKHDEDSGNSSTLLTPALNKTRSISTFSQRSTRSIKTTARTVPIGKTIGGGGSFSLPLPVEEDIPLDTKVTPETETTEEFFLEPPPGALEDEITSLTSPPKPIPNVFDSPEEFISDSLPPLDPSGSAVVVKKQGHAAFRNILPRASDKASRDKVPQSLVVLSSAEEDSNSDLESVDEVRSDHVSNVVARINKTSNSDGDTVDPLTASDTRNGGKFNSTTATVSAVSAVLLLALVGAALVYSVRRRKRAQKTKTCKLMTMLPEKILSLSVDECQSPDVESFLNRFDDDADLDSISLK
jgi:hypothetical protein